jgi:ketosteroid isomerase-like protein
MGRLLLLQFMLASGSLVAQAAPPGDSARIAQIIRLQHAIAAALVAGDEAFLDRTYAPEYTYVSPAGVVRTKAKVLAGRAARDLRTIALTYDDLMVRLFGQVALVTGRANATVIDYGHTSSGQSRFVRVQVFRNGRWQVVHYQVTRISSD